ncbi:MAG TPA: hypothetical protein VL360_03265 [Gammaproteobacteria bacterium]|jgi:hypothetical protein|nr:hypothetical protein [Gammaproteobacteria bacterium]
MKMNRIFIFSIMLPFISGNCFALLCPNNFNQINIGDSLAQVEQLCGKADKTETVDGPDNSPQDWNYYFPPTTPSPTLTNLAVQQQTTGSLKATFSFDAKGTLVNIMVNGISVGTTGGCGGSISLGDTRKNVESVCGKPSFVSKQDTGNNAQNNEANKQVEMTYMSNPPVVLIFRDGKLADSR